MKNIIKRIIIGVSVGMILYFLTGCSIVHAKQEINSMDIAPNRVQVTWRNGSAYGDFWTTPTLTFAGNYKTYQFSYNLTQAGLWKVAIEYNLSSIDSNFISFFIYNTNGKAPMVTLDAYPCEVINGMTNFGFNGSDPKFTTWFTGFNGYICRNPMKDNVWLDLHFADNSNLNTAGIVNIGAGVSYFTDSTQDSLQEINDELKDINKNIQETNTFLKDDSLPTNSSGDIGDLNNNIATNGTISSLVTMPITFLEKIINGLNGSCSPIVIGELYDYNMTMPCIQPQQYIGIIWNIIDVICAGFLSYSFGKKLVSIFHKVTSLKDGGLEEAYD